MPNEARQSSVTDNGSNKYGSMHLVQSTCNGAVCKDFVAWISTWLPKRTPKNFMNRPLFNVVFALHRVLKKLKHLPSNNVDITASSSADSNQQFSRRENMCNFLVQEINDEVVYDSVVEIANVIGVMISKQNISVCRPLPSKNP